MLRSIPITDHSELIAVAAQGDHGWYLIAIDPRLEELDRESFRSPQDAERVARSHLHRRPASASGRLASGEPR